jgi:glycerophosphoryl diester phosphodiesterase
VRGRLITGLSVAALGLTLCGAAQAAAPQVQSHRGGAERDGVPTFAEESMPGFRSAWEDLGTVLELDVKLSKDRVPVVIHDGTLDRTTPCTGRVDARTWAELRRDCPSDVLGIDPLPTVRAVPPVPMTRLRDLLDYAKASGATLNLEIKNIPGEPDFDPTPAYATTILDEIKASGLPVRQLIVQSFWPPNLDETQRQLPGAETAFLTSAGTTNAGGAAYARAHGYTWWSPGWPVTKADVDEAHGMGLKVVPWTLDTPQDIRAAAATGVEAVITNDPVMARAALAAPAAPRGPSGQVPAPSSPIAPGSRRPEAPVLLSHRAKVRRGAFTVRVRALARERRRLEAVLPDGTVAARGRLLAPSAGRYAVVMRLSSAGRRALARSRVLRMSVLGESLVAKGSKTAADKR